MERKLFEELLESAREMNAIRRGEAEPARVTRFEEPDVAAIRAETGFSQSEFAGLMGISTRTLQEWEQGRRSPRGPARALLYVTQHNPKAVLEGVSAAMVVGRPTRKRRKKQKRSKVA